MMAVFTERRLGVVQVSLPFILELTKPGNALMRAALFGSGVVLRCEFMVLHDYFQYEMWHEALDVVDKLHIPPLYDAVIHMVDDGSGRGVFEKIEWRRQ